MTMMMRRSWLAAVLVIGCLGLPGAVVAAGAERPNVLIITADNLGYNDLGCYGNEQIKTPRIDRLAAEGVRCTDLYVAGPTCTVSRATLLTGRYPERIGLNHQLGSEENLTGGLSKDELLIPHFMKQAGYATGCFGKWNIGFPPGARPTERGFDEFFGHASGNIDYYTHVYKGRPDMYRGTEQTHASGYSTGLFADAAIDFMRRHKDEPFFCYLPFNAPHFPDERNKAEGQKNIWQAPGRAFRKYGLKPDEPDPKKRYRAVVTAMDTAIGRVLDALDEMGLDEETIVVFFSDNGAFMLENRGLEVASNAPLRDGGVTVWEGGIRVPAVVRWPGEIEAGSVCSEPLIQMDFFSMALEVAGVKPPSDRVIDGKNPLPALKGEAGSPHEALYFLYRGGRAVREGRHKLIRPRGADEYRLYDLKEDIGETENIADQKPEIADRLREKYERWLADVRG